MSEDPWPSEWLRGILGLLVMRVLAEGPTYGYAIALRLAEAGLGTLKGGTLYPLLSRFERDGFVTVDWRAGEGGPGRKYYVLTALGHAALRAEGDRWSRFAALTSAHLAPSPEPDRTETDSAETDSTETTRSERGAP